METIGKVRGSSNTPGAYGSDPITNEQHQNVLTGRGILIHLYQVFGGSVRIDQLRTFVDIFCDSIIQTPTLSKSQNNGYFSNVDIVSCPICFGILMDPVTVECGHSYCKKCLVLEAAGSNCKRCRSSFTKDDVTNPKVNLFLGNLINKWWFIEVKAATFRNEGNNLFVSNEGEPALRKYSQALELTPNDPLALGNRSHVLLTLGRSEEALADIDAAVRNCPLWAKGYFRKSNVLVSLGRFEDAFLSLASCLCLTKAGKCENDAAILPVKVEMLKVLRKIFQQAAGNRRQSFEQLSQYPNILLHTVHDDIDQFESMGITGRGSEYNSTGKEYVLQKQGRDSRKISPYSKPSQYQQNKPKKNVSSLNDSHSSSEKKKSKIARLFDRSILEINRIHSIMMDTRTKGSTDIGRANFVSLPVDSSRVLSSDVECTLCYRLLHQPAVTFCGHTFCRVCLERSLDHSPACPLCKTSLEIYLANRKRNVTQFIEVVISKFFPTEHAERTQQHIEEIATTTSLGATDEISIFVCTMAFPTIQCPLFVFEPKYKLMIRRCMESGTKKFGMCMPVPGGGNSYADFGTLLEIRNVQYFADGRSVVDTIGRRRFRVIKKSQKDGYNTACVEILQDRAVQEDKIPRVMEIHDELYTEGKEWVNSISPSVQQRIQSHFDAMPTPETNWIESTDGPAWTWWLLAILPLQAKAQLAILSYCSLQQRLESMLKVVRWAKATQV